MKSLKDLENKLSNIEQKVLTEMVKAQRETAESIRVDTQELAPSKTGEYADSIVVKETIIKGNNIETPVESDMTVVSKEGNAYNLGFLLEHGTLPHAIPNAFNWGVLYGYDSEMYKRTLEPDWHPGFAELPHYYPALNKNKNLYKENINKALRRLFE